MGKETFSSALAMANEWIDEVEGVVAVGEGETDGTPVIDVWISGDTNTSDIPDEVGGHPVRVRETDGPITAQ